MFCLFLEYITHVSSPLHNLVVLFVYTDDLQDPVVPDLPHPRGEKK